MQPGMGCMRKDVDGVDDGFDDVECDGGKDDEDSNVPSKKAGNWLQPSCNRPGKSASTVGQGRQETVDVSRWWMILGSASLGGLGLHHIVDVLIDGFL